MSPRTWHVIFMKYTEQVLILRLWLNTALAWYALGLLVLWNQNGQIWPKMQSAKYGRSFITLHTQFPLGTRTPQFLA
eukprot:1149810-Pelagomonas_calceolata.AAC.3